VNEIEIATLGKYLEALSAAVIMIGQKTDAMEAVLQKQPEFAEAYRQELERMKARGQLSKLSSDIRTVQSILRRNA
jgi:hypothetical protein